MALNFVEPLELDRRQRILLGIDDPLLQREIHLFEGHRRGVGACRFRQYEEHGRVGHANLQAPHMVRMQDGPVGGHMAKSVVRQAENTRVRSVPVPGGQFPEQLAVAVGLPMRKVLQGVGKVGQSDGRKVVRDEGCPGIDDIDRPQQQGLVDRALATECRCRKDVNPVPAAGQAFELFRRPQGLLVVGRADFVDVRPAKRAQTVVLPPQRSYQRYSDDRRKRRWQCKFS